MRLLAVLLACLCAPSLFADDAAGGEAMIMPVPRTPGVVKSVTVRGGTVKVTLATRAGNALDQDLLRKDVRTLWATGQFEDIRVRTSDDTEGTAVVFDVTPKDKLVLRDFKIQPNSFGMTPSLTAGTPIDPLRAQQISEQVRQHLIGHGYAGATAEAELVPAGRNKVDLFIHVTPGEQIRVRNVEVVGETVFPAKEINRALQSLQTRRILPGIPGIWGGFKIRAVYSEEAVQADLARLQSFYLSRGHFDAHVAIDTAEVTGKEANVRLFVKAGPEYKINKLELQGKGIATRELDLADGKFATRELCGCLFHARRDAERKGIVDFSARLNFHNIEDSSSDNPLVDVATVVDEGRPYTIGRIDVQGTRHYSEANIRRNLLIGESELLDQTLLRRSIQRLNQTQMFDPIDEGQVAIHTDEATGVADITIPLKERHRGMWNLSGPVGPISFAGPLQFMIASRLPPWGRNIFELSTYYVSFSAIGYFSPLGKVLPLAWSKQGILPVLSVFRPYTPGEGWKSGFLIAPQLGWKTSVYSYATAQLTSRLVPLVQGGTRTPQLTVTFERAGGDGVLMCDPPKPRFHIVRGMTAMALQFLASTPGF